MSPKATSGAIRTTTGVHDKTDNCALDDENKIDSEPRFKSEGWLEEQEDKKDGNGYANRYRNAKEKSSASLSPEMPAVSAVSTTLMDKSISIPPTFSLWDYLDEFLDIVSIRNELYKPDPINNSSETDRDTVSLPTNYNSENERGNIIGSEQGKPDLAASNTNIFNRGLKPSVDPRVWKFWDSYFLRGSSVNLQRFQNNSRGCNHYAHQYMYKDHEKVFRNQISELKKKVNFLN